MFFTSRAPVVSLLGLIPVLIWPTWLTVLLVALTFVLIFVVDMVLAVPVSSIDIEDFGSHRVRAGETFELQTTVHNTGNRLVHLQVRLVFPPAVRLRQSRFTVRLEPGARLTLATSASADRTGYVAARPVIIRSTGRLTLAGREGQRRVRGGVHVLPEFRTSTQLPSRLRHLREIQSGATALSRGQGTEFDSLRTYVRGDDVRSIDWRATARRQETLVRTWQPERDRHIVIVLDTGRSAAARLGDTTRLAAGIEASLLLGVLADEAGDHVSFLAYDRQLRARVTGYKKDRFLAELAAACAGLRPQLIEPDYTGMYQEIHRLAPAGSLLVFLGSDDPYQIAQTLLPGVEQLAERFQVVFGAIADPDIHAAQVEPGSSDTEPETGAAADAYLDAAISRTRVEQRQAWRYLERRGVSVVSAPGDEIALAICDHYLSRKARGLL